MKEPKKTFLYWCPRILGIVFALFMSLFGFDVLDMGYGFPEIILALIMDMMPAILVAIAVVLAWRWEWIGTILFIGLAVLYMSMTSLEMDWVTFLLIPLPLTIVGVLWYLAWRQKQKYQQWLAA